LDLDSAAVRKITAPGSSSYLFQQMISPDGKWFSYVQVTGPATTGENVIFIAHPDGTEAHQVMKIEKGDAVAGWGPDSASFLVWDRNKVPADVDRIDIATGKRTRLVTLQPPDPVGIAGLPMVQMTPDGTAYAYNVVRRLSELYLVEGLK